MAGFALQWAPKCVPQHVEAIETANRLFGCVCQALHRVYPSAGVHPFSWRGTGEPLAVGGAMAVYKLTVHGGRHAFPLVCKIPHPRRLVYTSAADAQAQDDATSDLLDTLADLADTVNRRAVGLFPRCGGVWHWRDEGGTPRHLLIEAFIPGVSVERVVASIRTSATGRRVGRCRIRAASGQRRAAGGGDLRAAVGRPGPAAVHLRSQPVERSGARCRCGGERGRERHDY